LPTYSKVSITLRFRPKHVTKLSTVTENAK
jgi:hypothetical protein